MIGTADELTSSYGKGQYVVFDYWLVGYKIKTSLLSKPLCAPSLAQPSDLVVGDSECKKENANNPSPSEALANAEPQIALADRVHAFVMGLPGNAQLISSSNGLRHLKVYFWLPGTKVYDLDKNIQLSHIFDEINRNGYSEHLEISNTSMLALCFS